MCVCVCACAGTSVMPRALRTRVPVVVGQKPSRTSGAPFTLPRNVQPPKLTVQSIEHAVDELLPAEENILVLSEQGVQVATLTAPTVTEYLPGTKRQRLAEVSRRCAQAACSSSARGMHCSRLALYEEAGRRIV